MSKAKHQFHCDHILVEDDSGIGFQWHIVRLDDLRIVASRRDAGSAGRLLRELNNPPPKTENVPLAHVPNHKLPDVDGFVDDLVYVPAEARWEYRTTDTMKWNWLPLNDDGTVTVLVEG